MHQSNCKCAHHWLVKLFMVLASLSAIGFWLANAKEGMFWDLDITRWFYHFVVFALITFLTARSGACSCCCGGCNTCPIE